MVKKVEPVHPNQKGNKTMASENYTLVRAATGELYLISETECPRELKGEEETKAIDILDDCEKKLSSIIEMSVGTRTSVHVGVPTIFVKHK
jgi:hypothetical protein